MPDVGVAHPNCNSNLAMLDMQLNSLSRVAETLSDRHSDEQIYDRIDAKLQAVQDEITSHSKLKFFGGKCPGSCAALGCTGGMGDLMGAVKTSWENVQNKTKMDAVINRAKQDATAAGAGAAGKFGRRLLGRGKTQAAPVTPLFDPALKTKWQPWTLGNGCVSYVVGFNCMAKCGDTCCTGK